MSKVKYAILNGNQTIGLFWENEKLGNIFVTNPDVKIDLNWDLEIRDVKTGETVNSVDLRDFLLESLPLEFIKDNRINV
jgi:hypothetical protein